MKSWEIREKFLRYFESRGHRIVLSSSLIPAGDPTLLFTNAGMVQFKGAFLGESQPLSLRAASVQKCLRAGGKHNDLENVGRTHRHHTFFEMLGNFSFGDYFKEEAIPLAWEFLTREVTLPTARLWVTIYEEDEEAFDLWRKAVGIPVERIVRLGKEDNFWAMGETGPCGPCSEIVLDQGEQVGCRRPSCGVACPCDRFLELWNLVFMQYSRTLEGTLVPLPRPSIDTGMGLERLAAVLQGVTSNYQSDLFLPLLDLIQEISGQPYGARPDVEISMRVIADHARALAFLVAEGVLPENEGRGYVLRRILRRASRHGRRLGINEPFLYQVALAVVDIMGPVYPELKARPDQIAWVIQGEEERFNLTLDQGLRVLSEEIRSLKEAGERSLPGSLIFKLYDTFGFPTDLTQDVAREEGMDLDLAGFEAAMAEQRDRARRYFKEVVSREEVLWRDLADEVGPVDFLGYETTQAQGKVIKLAAEGRSVERAATPGLVDVVTAATPFYGEAGGQVGDQGEISAPGLKGQVLDTIRPYNNLIVHRVRIEEGHIQLGDMVTLQVDEAKRRATAANHTATHLLHAALRRILGTHVKQAGSLVAPDRLRFDFSHYTRVNEREILLIEDLVNEMIWENIPVTTLVVRLQEALEHGALAFFGEKYGDKVRVVKVADYSQELCGGTHARRTGDIGLFKIISEGAVAAGIRRMEALTSLGALAYLRKLEAGTRDLAETLKVVGDPEAIKTRVNMLLEKNLSLEKELSKGRSQLAHQEVEKLLTQTKTVDGVKALAARVPARDLKELREYGDLLRNRLKSGILLLGTVSQEKGLLVAMVTKDLTTRFDAASIVQQAAAHMGASGGGRKEMAQAGGGDPQRLEEALNSLFHHLR